MTDYLDNMDIFSGDGSRNERNQSLEEFLEAYDPNQFERASNTVDTLVLAYQGIFGAAGAGYRILMVKRRNHPCIGYWALPGGFLEMDESLEQAAKRELEEETGIKDVAVEQLYTWGDVKRDPRTRIITTSYLAVVEEGKLCPKAGDDAADADWFTVNIEEEKYSEDDEKEVRTYQLHLTNTDKKAELNAIIEVECRKNSILREKEYHILESELIAGDHSALIVQALLRLGITKI